MSDTLPYESIPTYPSAVTPGAVVARLLDGLGFRFRWATHGLTADEVLFSPAEGTMSILQLVQHIWGLVNWVHLSITGQKRERPSEFQQLRIAILDLIVDTRRRVANMGADELNQIAIEGLPFWHILNGPLADALTHVGQVNSFRRLAGNPTPSANVFTGTPPA